MYYTIITINLTHEVQIMNHFIIKDKEEVKKLMKLALSSGESMLKNGAETYRVEDTMVRICGSRENISNVDAFVTQTGIFLTLEYEDEIYSNFKRIKDVSINLKKIDALNQFSRNFVCTNISIDEGMEIIHKIDQMKGYSKLTKALLGATAAAFFCIMFGGNFKDFISSYLVSFFVIIILTKLEKFRLTFFIDNFLGAFLASLFSVITLELGLGENLDMIIIGSIMYLVPGVAITNAIRDTMSGDSLSGLSKGMEAVFCALAIAFGVGIILNFYVKGL